jgi:hypothetical protein
MERKGTRLLLTLCAIGLVSLACGLGKKGEEPTPPPAPVAPAPVAAPKVDVSDMPSYLHYPNASGTAKAAIDGVTGTGMVYTLETSDAADAVWSWYKTSLSSWEQISNSSDANGYQLVATAPGGHENATITIAAGVAGSKTTVTVTTTKTSIPAGSAGNASPDTHRVVRPRGGVKNRAPR